MKFSDLFQLQGMEKVQLLAGRSVLTREIKGAHVVEVVETEGWMNADELIFFSGVAFIHGDSDLKRVIVSCAEQSVAGVVVEIGPFISEISDEAIEIASQRNLPLLTIPYDVQVSNLISQIYFNIYKNETKNKFIENLMRELLYGDFVHGMDLLELYKSDSNRTKVVLYIGPVKREDCVNLDKLLSIVKTCFYSQDQMLYLQQEDGILLVLQRKGMDSLKHLMIEKTKSILLLVNQHLNGIKVCLGVSEEFEQIRNIRVCSEQAIKSFWIAKVMEQEKQICFYYNLGIYKLFFSVRDSDELKRLEEDILGALIAHDAKNNSSLVSTLEVYLKNNGSITETTKELYVHRNTVKYRIARIEDILDANLRDGEVQFNLRLAFKIKRFLDKK